MGASFYQSEGMRRGQDSKELRGRGSPRVCEVQGEKSSDDGGGLSPHGYWARSSRRALLGGGASKGRPQPSRPWRLAPGSLVENAHSLGDSGQAISLPTPTSATGNGCGLPGQPKLPPEDQVVSEDPSATTVKGCQPYPPIPKHSTAQTASSAGRSDRMPCPEVLLSSSVPSHALRPSPTEDGTGGVPLPIGGELAQRMCPK